MYINVEIKARCRNPDPIRNYLLSEGAEFKGIDEQSDTYFKVNRGRLKLREGNIENNLIFYERSDKEGPKSSFFHLLKVDEPEILKEMLRSALGTRVVVKKHREIYYINNVKFHIDLVPGLGSFIEIEAGNKTDPALDEMTLRQQCDRYLEIFKIPVEDLIKNSYSDMLLAMESREEPI